MERTFYQYLKKCVQVVASVIFNLFKLKKIDDKKIVFCRGTSQDFKNNFENIYEKLKYDGFKMYIVQRKNEKNKVLIKSYFLYNLIALYHLATAKYWFADSGFLSFLPKRKEQKNVMLWHGAGAFKIFGFTELKSKGIKYDKNKYKSIDLLTVSSDKIKKQYQDAFNIDINKIKNLGMPRADIFFHDELKNKIKENFLKKHCNLKNKKIILYAPTYRNGFKDKFQLKLDLKLMKQKLEPLGYVLLLRLHPGLKEDEINIDNKFSYNFNKYPLVSDLLIISDILISDYSSIIFEFSIMKKPMLFYSYDVEEYIKSRGFYYNYYDFIPNKICYTTEEVVNSILNKEWDLERIEKFARYFFNPFDGNSTNRVLEEIGIYQE